MRAVGVIEDTDQGRKNGERIDAKLVLWGQILEQDEGTIVHYQLLEAPGLTDDPDFPTTMTTVHPAISLQIPFPADVSDLSIQDIAARQNLGLTAFSLGLYYYIKELKPSKSARQFEMARDHLEASVQESELTLEKAKERANLGLVYYYLGKSYQLQGNFLASQEMLEEAEHLNPNDPAIYLGKSYNHRVFGETDEEQAALQRVIQLAKEHPVDDIAATFDRALAYEALKDDESAIREYQAILKQRPDFFATYLSTARILVRLGQFDEAQTLYDQAGALAAGDPVKNAWLQIDVGALREKQGRYEDAISAYQQAIALKPDLVTPHFRLATLYASQQMHDAALLSYDDVISLSDNQVWAHDIYGQFLFDIGQYEQAIDHFKIALESPAHNQALLYTNLGRTYAAVGDLHVANRQEHALEAFDRALDDPGGNEAYIRSVLGTILYHFGDVGRAIAELEHSIAVDDGLATEARLNLGRLYRETGNTEKAQEMYQYLLDHQNELPGEIVEVAREGLDQLAVESATPTPVPKG